MTDALKGVQKGQDKGKGLITVWDYDNNFSSFPYTEAEGELG